MLNKRFLDSSTLYFGLDFWAGLTLSIHFRDNYVTVLWNNIQLDRVNDFHKKDGISYGPYDYDSIMHYSTCGANKGRETIMRKVNDRIYNMELP